jgi:hypothetical protein
VESEDQNDAVRFQGRLMTENEFWQKSKPKCCSPCTSRHYCHATDEKDDWGVCKIVGRYTVVETADQTDAIRFLGRLMTEKAFRKKSKPKCCSPCTSRHYYHATNAKDDWGVCMIVGRYTVVEAAVRNGWRVVNHVGK